ncbi:MAG: hypothetical protein A2498_11695 [Lentisphaerae bacterium RIFOXYC12_FULL_60_16]|nr:MAG: hypothetical protein A2498_11695 [Lentisphaerae bacterium RIFOXYC12_FULL_60_16]OGV77264.1 MAG: hypothetical protein A2340_06040 [Lentisphaerae bacterium RIFOXYB12_FULL_60_10]
MAFMGFRHGHILSVLKLAQQRPDTEVVATCEEHADTRNALIQGGSVTITHQDYRHMLDSVPCDVVAVGDSYGRRGAIILEALRRGIHVIADKPICTSLKELDAIRTLAREKRLCIGCQLDLRDNPKAQTMRQVIQSNRLGEVLAISFTGQHPLNYGTRPAWYFEKGMHGGTLNDIAIHGIDLIPWATGHHVRRIEAARSWNAALPEVPWFHDGSQLMCTLDNGAGVLGDVSYFAPSNFGYKLPQYWRFTVWGKRGVLEFSMTTPEVILYSADNETPETIPLAEGTPGAYFDSFLREMRGETTGLALTTDEVLRSSRTTLLIQDAADNGRTKVDITEPA